MEGPDIDGAIKNEHFDTAGIHFVKEEDPVVKEIFNESAFDENVDQVSSAENDFHETHHRPLDLRISTATTNMVQDVNHGVCNQDRNLAGLTKSGSEIRAMLEQRNISTEQLSDDVVHNMVGTVKTSDTFCNHGGLGIKKPVIDTSKAWTDVDICMVKEENGPLLLKMDIDIENSEDMELTDDKLSGTEGSKFGNESVEMNQMKAGIKMEKDAADVLDSDSSDTIPGSWDLSEGSDENRQAYDKMNISIDDSNSSNSKTLPEDGPSHKDKTHKLILLDSENFIEKAGSHSLEPELLSEMGELDASEVEGEKKPYKCTMCSKQYTTKERLSAHVKVHTGEKPYQCPYCDMAFHRPSRLGIHMKIHTSEKLFKCEICEKRFLTSGNLIQHMKTHTGEKPFICTVCNKGFTRLSNMSTHMRTHTDEKPFQCTTCGKGFYQYNNLILHTRSHTGEKPFECRMCGKRYIASGSLSAHMRLHTGEKLFRCHVCDKTFVHSSRLTRHLTIHSKGTLKR